MRAHVATCVAIEQRGVLIEGPPGCGKSALALALIDRGAVLVGDDGVLLEAVDTLLIAHPHPMTRGLLEIRNLGLVSLPVRESVTIALVIMLDPGAPRFIDTVPTTDRLGIDLPCVAIWPESSPPVLKVEQALRFHGLRV